MTRKVRNTKRRKRRIRRTKYKKNVRGGAGAPPEGELDESLKTKLDTWKYIKKIMRFSLTSLIVSPLYIAAVLANIPLNTLNNLSGRSFNGHKTDALGLQLYKYMFEGYKKDTKNIQEKVEEASEKFIIDEGLTVKGDLVTKCDSDKCNVKRETPKMNGGYKMKGGYVNTYKTLKEMMGVMTREEQITHNLHSLEDTIDSMKFDFVGRKREIEKMFSHIKDPKLLLKFIVVSNNLIEVCEESFNPDEKVHLIEDNVIVKNPYQIVNENLTTPGEIFQAHLNGDVCFFNPDCMKSCNRCDVITTLSCALGSKTGVECDKCNCNLLSNIGSIYSAYVRILLKSFGGNSNNLYYISDLLFMVIRFYANSETKNKQKYKMVLNLNDLTLDSIKKIRYDGNFDSVKHDQMKVIELFKKLICKYGIYEIVKKNFIEAVNEAKKGGKEELEKLNKELLSICDAPDDDRETMKKGLKTLKNKLTSKLPFI